MKLLPCELQRRILAIYTTESILIKELEYIRLPFFKSKVENISDEDRDPIHI